MVPKSSLRHRENVDPVCGCELEPSDDPISRGYKGDVYLLCSESCEQRFKADPDKYVNA